MQATGGGRGGPAEGTAALFLPLGTLGRAWERPIDLLVAER